MIADELAHLRAMDPAERAEALANERHRADMETLRKGREAEAALALLDPHFTALREVCVREIISSHPDHTSLRERMIVTCQILDAVRSAVQACCVSGHDAMHRDILSRTVSLRR